MQSEQSNSEMDTPTLELQERFTRLAQHAFRVKISVLLLLLVALFAVWSTLTSGTSKAEEIGKNFCQQIIKDPYYSTNGFFGEYSCASSLFIPNTIEQARHEHDNDPPYPKTMSPEEVTKHLTEFTNHFQEFQDFEWNRRQAYRVELSLPYMRSSVSLSGWMISGMWPFCALLALSVTVALGLRQTCYEIHLSALIAHIKSKEAHGRDVALTEFVAGEISETTFDGRRVFLYKRPIGFFPEQIVSGVLFMAVSVLSLNLLTDYSPQFTERGKETFGAFYYLWLYLFAFGLLLLLLRTRRLWRAALHETLGGEVRSTRLFFVRKWLSFVHDRSIAGMPLGTAAIYFCVFAAFGSLILRWGDYRGFALLFFPARVFDDEPFAARIVQIAMILAVIFLLTSSSSRLLSQDWHGRLSTPLQKARHVGAWIILFISGFIFFYAVIGLYGIVKDYAVLPAFGLFNDPAIRNLENLPTLDDADFSLGFTGFVCSCAVLAILELVFEAERKIRHASS